MNGAARLERAGFLGIVVVNYGSHRLLAANLGGLDLGAIPARVVVVDNFKSHADSAAITELAAEHGWTLHALPRNVGFGAAVNLGVNVAAGQGCNSYLMLNPDVAVDQTVLGELLEATAAEPLALISPVIERPDGTMWFQGSRLSLDEAGIRRADAPPTDRSRAWLTGACLAFHDDLWTKLGGFDDDYFLYWEDVDLSVRCVDLGGSLIIRDDLVVVHDVGGTQDADGSRAKSTLYYYFNCRNRLVFASKHLSRRDQLRWLARTPADVRRVLLRGGRRQLLRPWNSVWPGVRGASAGFSVVLRSSSNRSASAAHGKNRVTG
ncbi:MAG: N-acetylglucosaminyl-diphospho-decaprenol L-rhamnosyltransferase [Pseudonocardiales bacterium]|jgi:GT2 family glycosyltransferase|nr:N-acetylglucosaminyl-diphospho-decaprenol L-rhamnosyltransferase [Pseudonocardiales bacterium]